MLRAWALARKLLIVAVRTTLELKKQVLSPYSDGFLTSTGTFQKFYSPGELGQWIESRLGPNLGSPAAPGVFLAFKDKRERQRFLASQFRRKRGPSRREIEKAVFEHHKTLLEPLMLFVQARGRLPGPKEIPESIKIQNIFGSVARAFSAVTAATGPEIWGQIRDERIVDLVVYLALDRFGGRPRLSDLAPELQLDIRALFSSYKRACQIADEALFAAGKTSAIDAACRQATHGKITLEALYVHSESIEELPPILRIYEGCARVLVGSVEGANVLKLNRVKPRVSYLSYRDFDRDPHPQLQGSLVVDLRKLDLNYWDYTDSENPFILHRKDLLVPDSYPLKKRFERLTRQEERRGLYDSGTPIGTAKDWSELLRSKGLQQRGHQIVRLSGQ